MHIRSIVIGLILLIGLTPVLGMDYGNLKDGVADYYASIFNISSNDVEVEIVNSPKLTLSGISINELQISSRSISPNLGYQTLWLSVPSKNIEQLPMSVRIAIYKTVAVADQTLNRDEEITTNTVSFKRMKMESLSPLPITADDPVFGLLAKQVIRQGSVLRQHMVKSNPDISAGDEVKVYLSKGPLTLVTSARTKNDARVGDMVRIICEKTGKILTAKVTSACTVEVQY